ncbi:MAG: glycosyltransferase [Lachnospiraceae bacterium]|nr:glycosyltransferase [Lachnospiraceae bacterium]
MDKIIDLINDENWEEAAECIYTYTSEGKYNDKLAILAATVHTHFGDSKSVLLNIEAGLEYNYKNYELYLMLGDYYADKNANQAYLCYENAEYFCRQNGSAEDLAIISEAKAFLSQMHTITVRPYSFVILSYNTLDLLKLCIKSIRLYCHPDTYELVVIDNASHDGSVEWLREQKDIILIENSENAGFPAGCNQGVAAAAKDNDIMFLNSDTVMTPNAMFTLRMGLYESEKNGQAGSVTNYAGNHQVISETFDDIEDYILYAAKNNIPREHASEYKTFLIGFALLSRRSALEQVGLFDERFTPGNLEDTDLGTRFLQHGYRNVLCWNSFIYHLGSQGFQNEHYAALITNNRKKYEQKWGFDPGYFNSVRNSLIKHISHDFTSPICVLEVGCATGSTLGRIQYLYPNSQVHGIELNETVAALGAASFDIICGNIESIELPYQTNFFDYIIFGDVLEHLTWPGAVLERLKPYLKENGAILASIPNIMHAEVIYDLLQGRFPYEAAGIRDRTHLRFFTKEECINLFTNAGYRVEKTESMELLGCTTAEYHPEFFDRLFAIDGVAERIQFDTYQWFVKAVKQ